MKYYLLIINLFIVFSLKAQQRAQFSQYFVNPFVLNPAVAGTEDFIDAKVGVRKQWLGFPGSPFTYYVSAHMPLGKPLNRRFGSVRGQKASWHGLGVYIYDDITGPTRRTAGYLAYAFNMPLSRKIRLSVGAHAGFQQFKVDGEDFILFHENDLTLNGVRSSIVPDLILGTWLYSDKYYIGLAAHQLLQNNLEFKEAPNQAARFQGDPSKLNNHYFLSAGYYVPMYEFGIVPSIMVKYVNPAPVSIDISARFTYKEGLAWAGLAYRSLDGVTVIAGITALDGRMPISYSYDLTTSKLIQYQTGSHEIVIGYRIPPKPKVPCPASFWN